MKLARIHDLADKTAREHAQAWFDRFEAAYAGESAARKTARDQLETHLIEALHDDASASVRQVDEALARLGAPEEIAAEWSGASLVSSQNGARQKIARLAGSLARGVSIVIGLLMLAAAFARVSDPASVGLFQLADGSWLVGTVNGQEVSKDVLGGWTVPVALSLALAFLIGASARSGVWSAITGWRKRGNVSPFS